MSSTVWAVPAANTRRRETDIFHFLKDARCSVRVVEVGCSRRVAYSTERLWTGALGARRRSERDRQGDLEVHLG
jgi:hypothetical protein